MPSFLRSQAAHETFMIGLDQLAEQLSRTARLQRVTEIEVAGYVEEAEATGQFSAGRTRLAVLLIGAVVMCLTLRGHLRGNNCKNGRPEPATCLGAARASAADRVRRYRQDDRQATGQGERKGVSLRRAAHRCSTLGRSPDPRGF